MKKLLNLVLVLSLLAPVAAIAEVETQEVEAQVSAAEMINATEAPFEVVTQEQVDAERVAKFNAVMPSAKQIQQVKKAEQVQPGYIRRGYEAVKFAGTRAVNAVKSAGIAGIDAAKAAGTYGLNAAQTAKAYVAAEWAKAQGVKGVSLFAGKAFLGTSITALVGYLAYKGIKAAYKKATKKSTKKIKKITGKRPVVAAKGK